MEKKEATFKVTLELDEKWARGQTEEELVEYLETRLNSSMGFKGAVQKFKLLGERLPARRVRQNVKL